MINALFTLGFRRPLWVVALVTAVTVLAAMGLPKLEIDTSFGNLIPENDPARVAYQQVMEEFGSDNLTIVYASDSNLWTPEGLQRLNELQLALERIEDVERVDSVFSLRAIRGIEPDDQNARTVSQIESMPVLADVPKTLADAEAARDRALANPLYLGNFLSTDGTATALLVSVGDNNDRPDFDQTLNDALEAALAPFRGDFDGLFQVGPPRIQSELAASLSGDFRLLAPLSAAALVLAMVVFLRSSVAAMVPLVTSALSIIWTFGLLGWLGVPMNMLSAMIPSLIIAIGSTEDTHLIAAYFRGLAENRKQEPNQARRTAIRYLASHAGLALILTVITTTLGFAANLFSDIGLIKQFSIAATVAMVANGIVTVLVVPPLLSQLGPARLPRAFIAEAEAKAQQRPAAHLSGRIVNLFRQSQRRFPIGILLITAGLVIFFLYEASKLYVTNDPLSYFPSDRPLVQDTRRISSELAGVRVFFVTLKADSDRAFLEPDNVRKLAEIQEFARAQDAYDRSLSLADHLRYVNEQFRGRFASSDLPETRALIAQYLLFFHRSELESYVSHDYRRANILVRHSISDSHTLNEYVRELEDALGTITGPGIQADIVGENLMVNQAAESLMVAQLKALALLLLLIFILMSIMFTSFKGGALALVPAIIPIALMFGIMGLLNIPLNPGTAMVAVIAVGIAVDGTIHLLARYNERCRKTSDYVQAVHDSMDDVATPLISSSLALALGFGMLLFSNFTVVAQFGALAAATMLISIVANLLVTPILMTRIRLVGLYQILSMRVDREVLDRSTLFSGMSGYQRRKAILISEMHEVEAGELLVEQGVVGRSMYLILEGEAEVIRRDGGSSRTLAMLKPGEIFGEIGYIRAVERTADVRARTPVTVLRFQFDRMQKDLKFFPTIVANLNFNISAILGERLADTLDHGNPG
ncbi:MAG: MMPL family transporter [Pseudomonadota bacterium]